MAVDLQKTYKTYQLLLPCFKFLYTLLEHTNVAVD
jgi:hypothetical protein